MRITGRALAILALSAACSPPAPPTAPSSAPSPPAQAAPAPAALVPRATLLAEADARRLSPALQDAARSPDADTRASALLALARLHDPAAYPLLSAALLDPAPDVRAHASLGIGALETDAPPTATAALLGALAAESDPARRADLLYDLGRLATDDALAALPTALASDVPLEREAACLAVANAGLRGRSVDPALLRRAASRARDDASPAVRRACAYSLGRVPPAANPVDADAIAAELARLLDDPDGDVRAMAARALPRYPAAAPVASLATLARDPDWIVATHALRALAPRVSAEHAEPLMAHVLDAALEDLLASRDVAAGPRLHLYLSALDAASPSARHSAVHTVATAALARLATVPDSLPATRDRGLAHCATAKLVDLGRGWPSRVDACGLEQISEPERRVLAAEVLAAVAASVPQRGVYLQRLLRHDDAAVRCAAVTAMGALDSPEARSAVITTLRDDDDLGVANTALEALRALDARHAERAAAAVLAGGAADDAWPGPEALTALRTAARRAIARDDPEALITWLHTAAALAPRDLAPLARPLAAHSNLAVRQAARALLEDGGLQTPDAAPASPANPLDHAAIAAAPSGRVRLETDRGPIVLELWPDRAPTTVARFVELVRAGFYDGLTFHRVVPAFVVQGGDPRGDGFGGPGWTQRCEDHRARYERGVVGMALAGRDTGGSQFFITLAPQPHLDARYTAFARVIEGMNAVDQLQRGDRIRRATLEHSSR